MITINPKIGGTIHLYKKCYLHVPQLPQVWKYKVIICCIRFLSSVDNNILLPSFSSMQWSAFNASLSRYFQFVSWLNNKLYHHAKFLILISIVIHRIHWFLSDPNNSYQLTLAHSLCFTISCLCFNNFLN